MYEELRGELYEESSADEDGSGPWSAVREDREGLLRLVSRVETHHAQILKGVLDICVLSSIVEEPTYGYALVQKLNERGVAVPNEGSIYLVLKRLAERGRIEAELVESGSGPARKVYSATEAGRDVLTAWEADWQAVRTGVEAVLAGRATAEESS